MINRRRAVYLAELCHPSTLKVPLIGQIHELNSPDGRPSPIRRTSTVCFRLSERAKLSPISDIDVDLAQFEITAIPSTRRPVGLGV